LADSQLLAHVSSSSCKGTSGWLAEQDLTSHKHTGHIGDGFKRIQ